ncbi:MAG: efflux RND transporter periplasmic adaptor subunit [Hahellaceae bacterium]|nr:efflux RND transporter periplasmic adaptor subunit [Hahellaceae bacterium]MCP5169626.1 efflux RND transporter periplasmic adaptor subunit [Hahellaceae bacterium]
MAKRMIIMILILGPILGGIFWFLGVFKPQMMAQYFANMKMPPATVSSSVAETQNWQPFAAANGSVIATQEVTVANEVEGLVKSIQFTSAQMVAEGDVLVQLDTAIDEAELKGLQASERLAQANYDRDKQLFERKAVSSLNFETSLAGLRNAQAAVESQKARIRKKTVRAPFSGMLGLRQIDPGQYVKAGSAIVSLQQLDKVYINFTLPEQAFAQVKPGLTVVAQVSAWPNREFRGKVSAIDARISESTRNFTVQATFDNADQALRPGMFAYVQLYTGALRDVVVVPESAVDPKLYGTSVFVISETKDQEDKPVLTVERRYVETGLTQKGMVEITTGLKAGEQVVTAGQLKLQNGSQVVINNSVTPGQTGTAAAAATGK